MLWRYDGDVSGGVDAEQDQAALESDGGGAFFGAVRFALAGTGGLSGVTSAEVRRASARARCFTGFREAGFAEDVLCVAVLRPEGRRRTVFRPAGAGAGGGGGTGSKSVGAAARSAGTMAFGTMALEAAESAASASWESIHSQMMRNDSFRSIPNADARYGTAPYMLLRPSARRRRRNVK